MILKQHALGYGLHFIPALLSVGLLLAAVFSPCAATVTSFWLIGTGCALGLAIGFYCLYEFRAGTSVKDLFKQFKQEHGSVFSRLLRRSYNDESANTPAAVYHTVRESVNALQSKIKEKIESLRVRGTRDVSQVEKLDGILVALNVCGVFAGSWRDALWVIRDELLKVGDETLQQNCREHLLELYSKARDADSRDTFKEGLWGKACTLFGRDRYSKKERALALKRTAPNFKDDGLFRAVAELPMRVTMAGG